MRNIAALILVSLALSSCGASFLNESGGAYQEDFDALKMVEVSDGISRSEAYTIAKAFFWSNISGCGFPDEPRIENDFWVSKTRIGYAGLPGDSIFINKKTGTITWG